jgi:hypothetical protein
MIPQIEDDSRRWRKEALLRRVLCGLESTIRLRHIDPDGPPLDDVRIEFTDLSARYLATLVEAVDILEAIIFASDGCVGHRHCQHSMEPWQRARALLRGKWDADEDPRSEWPARS